jgi:Phage terminase, small subunit
VSGLSKDPAKRAAQLANLDRSARLPAAGEKRALSHGAFAQVAAERMEQRERAIYEALAADAPLRDGAGELPRHDAVAVTLLAQCLARLDDVAANVRDFGVLEQRGKRKGQVRPAAEHEARLRREAARYLDALGMTPKSRAALGLDLARTVDLATAMSEPDAERRSRLMSDAGVPGHADITATPTGGVGDV